MYRVICQYLPDANVHAVTRPGRGAWRVIACEPSDSLPVSTSPVMVVGWSEGIPRLLLLSSPRHRQPNTWCSPRKILDEWLAQRATKQHNQRVTNE